jgi:hypothetical protein
LAANRERAARRMKPSRRYRQFTDRRLEILRTAASAFTRTGFTRATMEDIAELERKVFSPKGETSVEQLGLDFADLFIHSLKRTR